MVLSSCGGLLLKMYIVFGCCQGEPMRIIYRMRGLLGDATEEFIESLDSTTGETPSPF